MNISDIIAIRLKKVEAFVSLWFVLTERGLDENTAAQFAAEATGISLSDELLNKLKKPVK